MNIPELTKLITLILAISIAGERMVTFLKTLIPWLSPPTVPPLVDGQGDKDSVRKVVVMIIAFLSCWTAAALADVSTILKPVILGLLASGGSAFWTNILSYVNGIADIKKQHSLQERNKTADMTAANNRNNREIAALKRLRSVLQPDVTI